MHDDIGARQLVQQLGRQRLGAPGQMGVGQEQESHGNSPRAVLTDAGRAVSVPGRWAAR
ncbi:hypothetical protein Srufu_002600 [Streptomyces libani subsp. rufus]|nr:hypothetical protein Srufu_002600 [Streptomyces libani subsp. rufus]